VWPRMAQLRHPGIWQWVLCGFLGMGVNSFRLCHQFSAMMVAVDALAGTKSD
jgi:hypothetical protein